MEIAKNLEDKNYVFNLNTQEILKIEEIKKNGKRIQEVKIDFDISVDEGKSPKEKKKVNKPQSL